MGKQNNQKKNKQKNPNNLKTPKPKEFPEASSFLCSLPVFFLPGLAGKTGCFPF